MIFDWNFKATLNAGSICIPAAIYDEYGQLCECRMVSLWRTQRWMMRTARIWNDLHRTWKNYLLSGLFESHEELNCASN